MSRRDQRRLGVAVRGLAVLGLAALLLPPVLPARAQQPAPDAQELGLEVTVGHGGRSSGSSWVPVEVVLEPSRLLRGELTISTRSASGATSEVLDVEAAARTRRVHRFLVPNGPVTVRIAEPDREPLEVRGQQPEPERGFAIGYLGDAVPEGAPAVRAEPIGLVGTWVPVSPEWLTVGPGALDPLGALVAGDDALAALSPEARQGLRAAVVAGTDVLIADDDGVFAADPGLPVPTEGDWTLTVGDLAEDGSVALDGDPSAVVARRTTAGRGSVTVVEAVPGRAGLGTSSALWSQLLTPPGHVNVRQGDWAADLVPYQLERVFSTSGSSAPALPWLALFTVAYVLVVGPINGVVLGRLGRRELAWATVPIITVVFTAGAFLGVSGGRPAEGLAGRALVSLDGVGMEIVAAGVRAPTEGERAMTLEGQGWTARTLTQGGRPSILRRTAEGAEAELGLGGLQFGGLVASRPTEQRPPLEITATAAADGVAVTVRNTGGQPVEDVIVRAATATRSVGTLAPGEERELEVAMASLPRVQAYSDPFQGLRADGTASLGALLRDSFLDGSPGTAWAIGTQPTGAAPVRVDGVTPADRGLLIAAGTSVDDAGIISPFAIRREAFSPQRRGQRPSPLAFDDMDQALLRFALPPGTPPDGLRARLDTAEGGMRRSVDVWVPASRRWRPLSEAFPDGVGDPADLLDPLGVAWVRVEGDLYPFDYSGTSIDGLEARP